MVFCYKRRIPKLSILFILFLFSINMSFSRWESTTRVPGGYINVIATSTKYLFLGTQNGLYRSSNNGKNWELADKIFLGERITSILVSDSNIYVGTPRYIFLSTNYGKSWSEILRSRFPSFYLPDFNYFRPLALHNGYLYTAGTSSFYRTSNNGDKWELYQTYTKFLGFSFLSFKGNLYLGTLYDGLYILPDNADTLIRILDSMSIIQVTTNQKEIFILVSRIWGGPFSKDKYPNPPKILKSTDEGKTWIPIKTYDFNNINSIFCDSLSIYISISRKGIFRTTDDGETWESLNFGLDNLFITKIYKDRNNIYAGTSRDFFVSTDNGLHWTKSNEGLFCMFADKLITINNNIVATTFFGHSVLLSSDNGNSWTEISQGIDDFQLITIAAVKDYLLTGNGYRRKLTDSVWTKVIDRNFTSFLVLDTLIFGVSGGINRSTDLGKNWERLNNVSAAYNPPFVACENYFVFLSDNYPRELTVLPNFYRSKDTCKTFELLAGVSPSSDLPIYYTTDLACLNNQLFRVYYDQIYRSTDFANSWTYVNNNLPNDIISSIHTKSPFLFIGTEKSGVFYTTDYGDTWKELNDGLEDKSIVCFTSNNEYLFASTKNGWVWRYPIKDVPLNVNDNSNLNKTSMRIFNEPSNSQVLVSFEIEKPSFVSLKIYNILGNEVATLVSEELPPGRYTREWETSKYPSGVYFIHFQTDYFTQTRTIMVVK